MSILALMLILVAALGSGSLVAIFAWFYQRMKQLEGGRNDDSELALISEQLDVVRDQLGAMDDEMTRLNERVDFTEKLLEPGPPQGEGTPSP